MINEIHVPGGTDGIRKMHGPYYFVHFCWSRCKCMQSSWSCCLAAS